MRVLNLWQKNGVFKIEVIQPLLDMAAGSSSAALSYTGADEPGNLFMILFLNTFLLCCTTLFQYTLIYSCLHQFGAEAGSSFHIYHFDGSRD